MRARHNGKVARLPSSIRATVNQMLREGSTYVQIIDYLNSQKVEGMNVENISNWAETGYKEWLHDEEQRERSQLELDSVKEFVSDVPGHTIFDASIRLATAQIFQVIRECKTEDLKRVLAEDPARYFDIIKTYTRILNSAVQLENHRESLQALEQGSVDQDDEYTVLRVKTKYFTEFKMGFIRGLLSAQCANEKDLDEAERVFITNPAEPNAPKEVKGEAAHENSELKGNGGLENPKPAHHKGRK